MSNKKSHNKGTIAEGTIKGSKWSAEKRARFLSKANDGRDVILRDDHPGLDPDCKGAWVTSNLVGKFLSEGWEHVSGEDGGHASTVYRSSRGGQEEHFLMEIPLDWWLEKQAIHEQKQRALRAQFDAGADAEADATATVGKDGSEFFVDKMHSYKQVLRK